MGRKLVADVSADLETLPEIHRRNVPLSEIKRVAPQDLIRNAKNTEYFDTEEKAHLDLLREDIRKRGILVPLIARRDGTLLAGHNRLLLAEELRLKTVPVQYVQEDLSDEKEREFIINDNLLRRHLSIEKRMKLYKLRYPDFEERFLNPDNLPKAGRKKSDNSATTLEQIAEETGQSVSAVRMQVKRMRDTKQGGKSVQKSSKKNNHHNVMISKKTPPTIIEKARTLIEELESASAADRKKVLTLFRRAIEGK